MNSQETSVTIESSQLRKPIHKNVAKNLVNKLKNMEKYVECSSKTGEGVNKVFEEAVFAVLQKRLEIGKDVKRRPCCLCMF